MKKFSRKIICFISCFGAIILLPIIFFLFNKNSEKIDSFISSSITSDNEEYLKIEEENCLIEYRLSRDRDAFEINKLNCEKSFDRQLFLHDKIISHILEKYPQVKRFTLHLEYFLENKEIGNRMILATKEILYEDYKLRPAYGSPDKLAGIIQRENEYLFKELKDIFKKHNLKLKYNSFEKTWWCQADQCESWVLIKDKNIDPNKKVIEGLGSVWFDLSEEPL